MSDTPRTDAVVVWTEDVHSQAGIGWSVVAAVHARKLEREADGLRRELAVANEKLAALHAQRVCEVTPALVVDYGRVQSERDRYKAAVDKLAAALRANTVASQKDCACLACQTARKALEEAGV